MFELFICKFIPWKEEGLKDEKLMTMLKYDMQIGESINLCFKFLVEIETTQVIPLNNQDDQERIKLQHKFKISPLAEDEYYEALHDSPFEGYFCQHIYLETCLTSSNEDEDDDSPDPGW